VGQAGAAVFVPFPRRTVAASPQLQQVLMLRPQPAEQANPGGMGCTCSSQPSEVGDGLGRER
jgi:hypothetical protein